VTVAQLRRTLDALADIPAEAMREATDLVESFATQSGRPVKIKGKTYQLSAVTKVTRSANGVTATVYGKPTGFWVWQNTGTKPHDIAPKRGKRQGRPRVIAPSAGSGGGWNHPQSVPVHHKGATGRGRWREVDRRARREVPQVFVDAVREVVARG